MAYQENPQLQNQIRNKITSILHQKMMDPMYDGRGYAYNDMESRVYNVIDEMNERKSQPAPCVGKKYCTGYNWKKKAKPNMYGYGIMEYMQKRYKKRKNTKRVHSGKVASKKNKWIQFLYKWREANPHITGPEALKMAAAEYRNVR